MSRWLVRATVQERVGRFDEHYVAFASDALRAARSSLTLRKHLVEPLEWLCSDPARVAALSRVMHHYSQAACPHVS